MLADRGTAAGRPNPPASSVGVSPLGNSSSASGFPRVSTTILSSTGSSSRAGKTDSNSARASRCPNGEMRSSGRPLSASSTWRVANRRAIRSANRRRATNASARADALIQPMGVINDSEERPLLGRLGQQAEDRQSDQERIRRRPRTESKRDAERLVLGLRETVQKVEERGTQLLNRREWKLHLRFDAGRAGDPKLRAQPRRRTRAARSCRRPPRRARPTRRRARRPATGRVPRARVRGRTTALLTKAGRDASPHFDGHHCRERRPVPTRCFTLHLVQLPRSSARPPMNAERRHGSRATGDAGASRTTGFLDARRYRSLSEWSIPRGTCSPVRKLRCR